MYEKTLLERIESLESGIGESGENSSEIEIRSVMNYVRKILNTNRGSVMISDDFGMPDMTVFSGGGVSDTMERIEKSILETVTKYEKRLSDVKVMVDTEQNDVLSIHLSMEGVLTRQKNAPVFFESVVKPGGKVNIKR
ncbi:MAG: type VI secretion system baseplate subunit TssE [Desulfobacteraceae bacterium]